MRAVVVKEGKLLILRESQAYKTGSNRGKYGLPGGKIRPGERYQEALRRELVEECGLQVEIGQPIYVDEWWPAIAQGQVQIIGIFFECSSVSTEVKLSGDFDDYQWITLGDYKKYNLVDPEPKAVAAYIGLKK